MKREEDAMSSAKHFTEVLIGERYILSADLKAKNICRKYLPI